MQYYDLLGRALETYPPQVGPEATYTKTVYLPWETRVYDERDTSEGTWLYPAATRVDGQGRVVDILKHNDYDGLFTELHWQVAYDGRGSIISIVDPHGHGRSYSYDSLARRTHIDDPNAGTLDYTYDDTGSLLTRTDAIGQVVENTYGLVGRLHETHLRPSATEPALSSYIYHYDEASPEFPTAQNLRGQLAWIEGPVSSTYSSYDEQGRIVSVLRQIWDPASSDFESQVRDSFQADFLLDPQGKLLGATLPGGLQLAYDYNGRELLESLTASFSGTAAASLAGVLYDAQGKVMQSDRGNGTRRCAGYDRRQRLTSLTAGPSSDTLCDSGTGAFLALHYDYGPAGLISAVTDTSVDLAGIPRLDAAFEYDRLYELVQSTTVHGTTNYSYDAIQNITRVDTDVPYPPFATGDFAYGENGAGPNALTRAGDVTLSYDAAGYARTYRGHELVFDPAGRMIVARDGRGTVIRNHYDAGGERVLKITEQPGEPAAVYRYIFDGYQERRGEPTWILSAGGGPVAEITETAGLVPDLFLLEELSGYLLDPVSQPRPAPQELLDLDGDGDGVFDADDLDVAARRYLGTPAAAAPVRVVRYYYGDHLGGTTHVADALGEVVSHSEYQAYGSLLSQRGVQPVYGFTGAEREPETDLGLMRMGARWYAPAVGRWVSADPLFLQDPRNGVESALELGLYAYALNSPIAVTDPTGLAGTVDSIDDRYIIRDQKVLDALEEYRSPKPFVNPLLNYRNPKDVDAILAYAEEVGDDDLAALARHARGTKDGVESSLLQPTDLVGLAIVAKSLVSAGLRVGVSALGTSAGRQATRDALGQLGKRAAAALERRGAARGRAIVDAATETFEQALRRPPDVVNGFKFFGNKGLVGNTFNRNVFLIEAQKKGASSLRGLVGALEAEARAAGASQLRIVGHAVVNKGFFSPRVALRFGFQFRRINDSTIELFKVLQ